jgi:spoIIIJ-associated protein
MPITDKVSAANRINEFLRGVVSNSGLRIKYRITVDPPLPEGRDWERPEILVEFIGPDSPLLLERGGELLRALELLALEMLRLPGNEHEKICFDCMNRRSMRLEELRMAATVAADKV